MWMTLHAFKRQYHKAKDICKKFPPDSSLSLQLKWSGELGGSAEVSVADTQVMNRLVVVMRRFLTPSDTLYYRKVWQQLNDEFADEISEEDVALYDTLAAGLSQGQFPITYNGDSLTLERCYELISEGEYFARDSDYRQILAPMFNVPFFGKLLWFLFYQYTLNAVTLMSFLFDVIKKMEKSAAYKKRYEQLESVQNLCIFCKSSTEPFTTREHIIPEALSSNDMVLPKGLVCDRCNNGALARLDSALAQSPFLSSSVSCLSRMIRKANGPRSNIAREFSRGTLRWILPSKRMMNCQRCKLPR
jgi:HNH endonuclease